MAASEDEITPAPPPGEVVTQRSSRFDQEDSSAFVLEPTSNDGAIPTPFAFSVLHFHRLIDARDRTALRAFGGIDGLARGLATDLQAGLSIDEDILTKKISLQEAVHPGLDDHIGPNKKSSEPPPHSGSDSPGNFSTRRSIYGENRVPRKKPKTFLQLLWLAYNDKLMFLLSASAVVSLALGIYQSTRPDEDGPRIEWVEGVTILAAVIIIVLATALNDYQKNSKFQKLNQRKEERNMVVTRSGQNRPISVFDVVVGDVLHIEVGDVVPADGVLIEASSIQCDESSLTGESDLVDKMPTRLSRGDPFVLSGTRVVAGVGRFLVVSVGVNSNYGRILMSLDDEVQETPLQQKLSVMAKYIINVGFAAGIIFFVIMLARFLARLGDIEGGSAAKGQEFLELFILSITVVVIVVPEGLPLTVTLALAFATTRMLKDNNLVRLLRSCETMGSATTVCSDKTGTLTENKMTVVAGCLGTSLQFSDSATLPEDDDQLISENLIANLQPEAAHLVKTSLCLNSTAMETDTAGEFIGSGTETALLKFARDCLAMNPLGQERSQANIVHMIPFDATRKWMAVALRTESGQLRLLVKGAAEIVLDKCSQSLADPRLGLSEHALTSTDKSRLGGIFHGHAENLLRVVAVAYKDLDDTAVDEPTELGDTISAAVVDLTFVGAFCIRDPLRPNVAESVLQCQDAGVFVRMVTGDNFVTAKAIASEAGIYTAGGIAMDGPTFRRLTVAQLDIVAPRLQVLARSSPEDKSRLVSHLKTLDEVVAVTGDGTNDALALKAADVGFSMGISGTEVAKEASAIVLMDDNFASIVKAIAWGRAVNDAAKKFLQFQFTINVTAGSLTIISALISGAESSVFTVVQLLWINLIMDTFAALALSTDFPTQTSLQRRPEPRTASLLSTTAWKMIMGQSAYQMAVIFTLFYAGPNLYNVQNEHDEQALQTMIFNIYVWMQFFNQSNSRRADNNLNIFEGVQRNPWFVFVQVVTLAGQLVIVFVGGQAFNTVPLSAAQWGWSMLFGIITIPLGAAIRLVPDELVYGAWRAVTSPFQALAVRLPRFAAGEEQAATSGRMSRLRRLGGKFVKSSGAHADPEATATCVVQPPTAAVSNSAPSEVPFDLEGAIDASRYGTSARPVGFEVHPDTLKHDPVVDLNSRPEGYPPSQDEKLRYYMGIGR